MSSSALPQTLHSITNTKINELSKQRILFQKRKDEILHLAANSPDLRSKAQILLEGVTKLKGYPGDAFDQEDQAQDLDSDGADDADEAAVRDGTPRATHVNIRRFLLQSRYDPSVSDGCLRSWIGELERELRFLQLRHEHAAFYSELVTEWLTDLQSGSESGSASQSDGDGGGGAGSAGFEQVGRAEMHEQRAIWETLAFQKADVDQDAIRAYLDSLFATTNLSRQALKTLRESIRSFGTEMTAKRTWFTIDELEWVSRALLKSDLLTKEKTEILKEFMRNHAVAQEVVDVLNMRLASLESWAWPAEGIPLEMRRQLNGKYRVFMDEDLLDALMFQYLGLKWAVAFRSAFEAFLSSPAWTNAREHIPRAYRDRRKYFLDDVAGSSCINDHRRETYKRDYFMAQLPASVEAAVPQYGDDDGSEDDKRKNALETKHSLLHLLVTESILQTSLHGEFTVVRSDFKWFGPSLPHPTMLTVLAYFGVPESWLSFFRTFLEAPLKFTQDGPDAPAQVRRRGIPMCHALSDCLGDAVLFCMDYTVNQATDGAYLYRLHDDFWFWGSEKTCVTAWGAMTEFARIVGLEFNEEKTGTARLQGKKKGEDAASAQTSRDTQVHPSLPTGDIRWGFLKLNPHEGRFVIDQEQVDTHIDELRHQVLSCNSVFAWVQAWNSYFGRFFTNNFAKPAMCFGRAHIDMAIATLSRIERTLFPASPGGVTDHLRSMITQRFGVTDLPEGFFFFPVELGGMGLVNPYIPFLAMRENIKQTPQGHLRKAFVQDEARYQSDKEAFEKNGPALATLASTLDIKDQNFLTLDEYMQYAESYSPSLLKAYKNLISVPAEISINQTTELRRNQMSLDETVTGDGIHNSHIISGEWDCMSSYWQWTAELYQTEMVQKYGGLAAVNREFMPLGVVKTLKEGKFRWRG